MFQKKRNKTEKAQSTLEYAMFVFIMVAALLSMQVYIKRAMQGRFRAVADNFGEQYAPKHTNSEIWTESNSDVTTKVTTVLLDDGEGNERSETTTEVTTDYDETRRWGYENLEALESNLFDESSSSENTTPPRPRPRR